MRLRGCPALMYVASAGICNSGAVNLDRDSSSIDVEKVGEYPGLSQINQIDTTRRPVTHAYQPKRSSEIRIFDTSSETNSQACAISYERHASSPGGMRMGGAWLKALITNQTPKQEKLTSTAVLLSLDSPRRRCQRTSDLCMTRR